MRKAVVILWLAVLFTGIIIIFWRNEWIYNLPTPVPENYKTVNTGETISLPGVLHRENNKPMFLHFFNPRCPCSRFNMDHFKSLVKAYGEEVNFSIILITDGHYSEQQIQVKYNISVPVISDSSIAGICGVYSTPQAVIIEEKQKLFYRGNYNRTRYCTEKTTEYARIALEALLNKRETAILDKFATKAYGCKLPVCDK